ncbi:calpain-5-like [Hemiscyllium ocellatum]|uniref:calpain-5-like n=1 Tax=Hemiscyllium ocellatum TaxID=170820 RepID=UPI002965D17B|nr:calpain-5-like [Hemiscyllium ocellatum]XP_060710439.1 calpain-5-like [Hemiscyllium ocellatum]
MPQRVRRYKGQDYRALRRSCQRQRSLFEDPHFPVTNDSIYYTKSPPGTIEWKRPGELCEDPRLFVDGISSRDLNQGSLGNCWFVAACSCLATEPSLWKKVIPDHGSQEWNPKRPGDYAGIFHFRFCRFGAWLDVVIDDRLPTMNGQLIFCHSADHREFWCSLLEKAYAKLNGCYEALDGGNTGDALVDFTGGVSEPVALTQGDYSGDLDKRNRLYHNLLKAHSRSSLISCSIRPDPGEQLEAQMDCGLVKGHAYGVTDVRKVRVGQGLMAFFKQEKLYMIRMRNPWGSTEWNGPWSDGSEEWQKISKAERENIGVTVRDDGEFWMDFEDFVRNFTDLVVCRQINTSLFSFHKTWAEASLFGEWTVCSYPLQNRSGGCLNNRTTFLQNPQFVFQIPRDDSALMSLQQEDRRLYRKDGSGNNLSIGFEIFRVEENRKYRMHALQQQATGTTYSNSRSVFLRSELKQGRYVVIPSTFDPGQSGKFLLRLFTETTSRLRELTLDQPKPSFWSCCLGYPKRVTSVHVHSAAGLRLPDSPSLPDAYAVIQSEGVSVKSKVHEAESNPDFDLKGLFYRKHEKKPIKIQVWSRRFLRDLLLGEVTVAADQNEMASSYVLQLQTRSDCSPPAGSLLVEISSSDDLTAL